MFNVRPDQFWPWIHLEPPSKDPPGFGVAADGSIRASAPGSELPSDGSGPNPVEPFDGEFSNPYRAISRGFPGETNGADPIPPFGTGSLPQFTSLLFPRLAEPQTMWPGLQGHIGEPDAKPDTTLPGLHHFKPPADCPPGFRVADDSSVRNGSQDDPHLWSLGHDLSSDGFRPIRDDSNPFDLPGQQRENINPIPSFDGGSFPPHATSLLFPQLMEPQFFWSSPSDDAVKLDAPPPRFHVEPWNDESATPRIPGNDLVGDSLSEQMDVPSFGDDSVANVASSIEADSPGGVLPGTTDPATYLFSGSTGLTAPLRDPAQEALDQIARIYRIDWQGSDGLRTAFHDGRSADGPAPALGDAFDPRYIVPTGAPTSPPPGRGHNGGPPLRPDATSRIPTQPSRAAPSQANPSAPQPPDSSAAAAGAAAAGTVATEKPNEPAPPDPEAAEKLEAWQTIVSVRGQAAPTSQYLGPSGRNTNAGVRLNPKLPEPAAGWGYLPAMRHLRDGYRGELQLANRIVAALPNEIVIHYGMPAGRVGPDVISLSPNGTVSIWDSKWRSGQRSISPSQRAHQSEGSFNSLQWELRQRIAEAARSGHLAPDVAAMARKNVDAGNFDIYTIGTGNAHGGVAESVRDSFRSGTRRP
jgi:hypothetical protein